MRYRAQSPALARPAFTVDALRRSKIQPCGTRVRSPGSCCGSGPLPVPPRNGSDGLQTGGSAPTSRLRRSGARRTATSLPSSRSCCGCHGMRLRSFREHRTTGSWSGSPAAVRPTSTRGFRRCRRGTTRAGPGDGGGRGWAHRKSGWGRRDPAERSQFTRLCADWRRECRGPADRHYRVPSDSGKCRCVPPTLRSINGLSCYNVPSGSDRNPLVPAVFMISNW